MSEQKPTNKFALWDDSGNRYEIHEFKTVSVVDQKEFTVKPQHIVSTYYSTSEGEKVEVNNDMYHIEKDDGTKVNLYPCSSS